MKDEVSATSETTPSQFMTKSRAEMIQFIAEEWTDNIDIKSYLQHMFYEYSDQLNDWTDKDIETEFKALDSN